MEMRCSSRRWLLFHNSATRARQSARMSQAKLSIGLSMMIRCNFVHSSCFHFASILSLRVRASSIQLKPHDEISQCHDVSVQPSYGEIRDLHPALSAPSIASHTSECF